MSNEKPIASNNSEPDKKAPPRLGVFSEKKESKSQVKDQGVKSNETEKSHAANFRKRQNEEKQTKGRFF